MTGARAATAALFALLLGLAHVPSDAQSPLRVRGTLEAAAGDTLSVRLPDDRHVEIHLSESTTIVVAQPIALSDIQAGDFVGVTSVRRRDGTLAAFDVRRFPRPLNPGHRPFDGRDDQTMTNATVDALVHSARGRELVLQYEGGSQRVSLAEGATISSLTPGGRSALVPGTFVSLTADRDGNDRLTALNVEVRRDMPRPPTQ